MTIKPLPPATFFALRPWPLSVPYRFFDDWRAVRPNLDAAAFDSALSWWLMDAAFLSYAPPDAVRSALGDAGIDATVRPFSAGSTQCYVISAPDRHVLVFRGTQVDAFWPAVLDWAVDFQIEPTPDAHGDIVHAGFNSALSAVWNEVTAYLERALLQPPARRLWITGHSLGAALATLAANRCADRPQILPHLAACYTFGSPRVGSASFGAHIPCAVYRVRNNSDVVTNVPPELLLKHVGEVEFLDNNGHLHQAWIEHTDLVHRLLDLNPALLSALNVASALQQAAVIVPGPIADHAPINYATLLWNALQV